MVNCQIFDYGIHFQEPMASSCDIEMKCLYRRRFGQKSSEKTKENQSLKGFHHLRWTRITCFNVRIASGFGFASRISLLNVGN